MKNVRKSISISYKIFSMLGILIISFVVYSFIATLGLNQAKDVIEELADTYLDMQTQNELVSKNVAEVRLYSNLIVLMPDQNSASAMAEMVPGYMIDIHTTLDENGVDKKCFSIISNDNLVLSQEEKDKLGEAYIGEEVLMGGVVVLEVEKHIRLYKS